MSALKYSYHEERGEFHGYVEDEMGNVIFEMHYPEFYEDDETGELLESSTIFEDGFMKHADDTEGLRKYLVDMRLINEDDEVIHEDDFKSQYNDGGLTSGAYGHGTTLLEEGGEMDIEEEDKEENEIEEHLQSISDDTGIPVDVLRSYADEIGTDYMDLTNDIPYNGAFGTQEDFAEHLVDNGLITDLSNYLYMTDLDIRILAGEEADARLDGMDDEDIAELAGKSDEYEELKDDLERLEELNDEIDVLESDIKARRDAFDHENATEEERDDFDDAQKSDEEELEQAKEQRELLDNKIEWSSIDDFIDDIRDDALSNANDEITEELEKDAVGYFENLGYSPQDLANHSLFSIDYEKLAEDVSYDYIFIEGEDGDYHIFNNYADGGAIPEGYHQMPDGTIMPDSAHLEHGGDVAESNLHMLKNQAEQFEHHANELQEALKKNPRVDAWVVAKAERAATDLSDITHYLEGLNHEHHGDGEDVIKMDVPLFIRSQEYAREDAKSDADLHEFADNAIDLSQSGETLEMDDYNKLVPNQMARGGNTNPYIDLNYKDRTQEIENLFEPTLEDIKKDPKYYAELVNDLLFHWVYGTRETPLMVHAKKSLPNHMAKGGVLASSSSREGIEKLISEYYYGSKITLNKVGNAYEVSNAKGKIKGVKVVEKNGKYQFVSDTKMMARGGVNFGASFDKLKKEILDPSIYSARDLKVGETYEWTIGAEPLKVKYLGLADENKDKKASSSIGKGFLFEWVHNAGRYVELGGMALNQVLRKITGYAKGGRLKEVQRNKFEYKGHLITINKRGDKEYTYQIDYYWWSPVYESRQKALEEAMQHINEGNLKMGKGGRVLSDVDMFVEIHGYYPESVMALRGDGMGLGIIRNEAHNFELSGKDSKKAEEMGYEFDYDKKGWVEKEEDDDDYARGGETNKYEIYHETLSSVLNEVENWAKKNGVEIRGDYFPDVKIGGINYGETKRFSIPIIKEGKKDYAKIMIQVYRMDSGRYELNMYPTYAEGGRTKLEGWDKNNSIFAYGYAKDREVKHDGTFEQFKKSYFKEVPKEGHYNDKVLRYAYDELNKNKRFAKGGATFDDKVKAISSSLTGKEVPKRLRKDYGKKYNKKEALEAARRIAGSMRAKEMKKGKK